VDPVMVSKHGLPLVAEDARRAIVEKLLPRAFLTTPNIPEAAALAGMEIGSPEDMREAARRIHAMGPRAVLVKGGHMAGDAADLLYDGRGWREYREARVDTRHTHGTGCTYSAAITALLALGEPLERAVERAKAYITEAIRTNPGLGRGCGPVNHHARCDRLEI
jgi:hydroxymethylpyrimidine/phosphomethylpyrimidine kinase